MIATNTEPSIRVGLMSNASTVRLALGGTFASSPGTTIPEGDYSVAVAGSKVKLEGPSHSETPALMLTPLDLSSCRATIHDVTIGIGFHWERTESQSVQGAVAFVPTERGITVINELPLEAYLASVISSEMSASCPAELLRSHAIVSRSWLLAQLMKPSDRDAGESPRSSEDEIVRWYDRENHSGFDVCADDHCQRYQGISKA
ncbi:MAG TPA: SpoIID/LytB domain-containing protein, partial [Blastocatellia bacterium]|nr:SpoIID/LytB domain-containing protein [Blastocatellia bacterium]